MKNIIRIVTNKGFAHLIKVAMWVFLCLLITVFIVSCKGHKIKIQNNSIIENIKEYQDTTKILTFKDSIACILKDTIKSKYYKDIISQDSIKIIGFEKYLVDNKISERIVYIDFRKNNPDKIELMKYNVSEHLSDTIKCRFGQRKKYLQKNIFKFLNNNYISIQKINNKYCIDVISIYAPETINDSSIILNSMLGYDVCHFNSIRKEDDKFIFDLENNFYSAISLEIKQIDKIKNVQIWGFNEHSSEHDSNSFYELRIPISKIKEYPIEYCLFSKGWDMPDKFDKIDYKKIFNQNLKITKILLQ